jgi:hypothetical protein
VTFAVARQIRAKPVAAAAWAEDADGQGALH